MIASEMYSHIYEPKCGLAAAGGGSVEGFGLPFGCQQFEVAPGVLVLLNGLKERLEVSCPKALEGEQTHTDG